MGAQNRPALKSASHGEKMEVSGLVSDGEKFSELDGNSKDHSCGLFHYRRDGE